MTRFPLLLGLVASLFLLGCPPAPVDDDDTTTVDDDDITVDDDDTTVDDDDTTADDDDDTTANLPPIALDDEAETEVGTSVWIDVLANDTDPENQDLEIEVLSPGAHGATAQDSGGVLYTPDPTFVGTDTFDYLVGDPGGLGDGAHVTVDVRCAGGFELMSAASPGVPGDGGSRDVALSGDGTVVAFASDASDLVPGDTNGMTDIYLVDREEGTIERVSMGWDGAEPDNASQDVSVSADGAWVAFVSYASNLVENDTNGFRDVFLWERATGTTILASINILGGQSDGSSDDPQLSADGRYVAFTSFGHLDPVQLYATSDVFVFDRVTTDVELISVSLGGTDGIQTSSYPSISGDGNLVAFAAMAWNLVADDVDFFVDIFIRDRDAETTTRVNLPFGLPQADGHSSKPALSGDGTVVAFESEATNLTVGDTEGVTDIFATQLATATVQRISVDSLEVPSTEDSLWSTISEDGRIVGFLSEGVLDASGNAGIRDLYVRDRTAGTTALASVGCSGQPNTDDVRPPIAISPDGSSLVFESGEAALMAPLPDEGGDRDIYLVPNPLVP